MPQSVIAGGADTLWELEAHDGQRQAVRRARGAHRRAAPAAVVLPQTWGGGLFSTQETFITAKYTRPKVKSLKEISLVKRLYREKNAVKFM